MKKIVTLQLIALFFSLLSVSGWAKVIYVVGDAVGNADGSSWEDAFYQIWQAMDVAEAGDEIWVKKGDFVEPVILNMDVSLYGGFAGTEAALSERNIEENETILDGTGRYYSVVLMTKGRLDGFTIKGGRGTERQYKDVFQRFGGCILVDYNSEDPIVSHCRITGNEASLSGFAFACLDAEQLLIEDCVVEQNREPYGRDGLLLCDGAAATIRRCVMRDNDGDGLFCDDNNAVVLEDCEFVNNKRGGVWFVGSTVDVKRCRFQYNSWRGMNFVYGSTGIVADSIIEENNVDSTEEPYYSGGGMYITVESNPTFYNCVIRKNRVNKKKDHAGGGMLIEDSSPVFIQCRIEENTAFLDTYCVGGGGVYVAGMKSHAKFFNTMFLNNEGDLGGGVLIEYKSQVDIHGCIFSGNKSRYAESALICRNDSTVNLSNITSINNTLLPYPFSVYYADFGYSYTYSIMNIDESILWDQVPEIAVGSGVTCNVSNSCIIGGWPGEGNISENPLLIDEGSTTQTESKEWLWEEGYYMLQSKALGFPEDSSCIDAGTTDTASNDAALPPGQGTSRCDMGAFGGPYNEGWKYYLVGPLVNYMMGVSPGYPFDANNDGKIDAADIVDCIGYIPPLP